MAASYPVGLPVDLDFTVRRLPESRVLVGRRGSSMLHLDDEQVAALADLEAGGARADQPEARALARILIDGGYAHPRPSAAEVADVTIVIPVRDRAVALDATLRVLGDLVPVIVVDDGSVDPDAVAKVAKEHGAQLVVRPVNAGPGPARNTGVAAVNTTFVAFLDSVCRPEPDWLTRLLGHFADPTVAAVAPRLLDVHDATVTGRYLDARSTLDLGPEPALVRPGARVSFVPTGALIVRMAAIGDAPFDPDLRYGEDVDLCWRLHDQGWQVRYDPSVRVDVVKPASWGELLRRRYRYGTGSAKLAERHPYRITPVVVDPEPAVIAALLFLRRPVAALGALLVPVLRARRRLQAADIPGAAANRGAVVGVARSVVSTASHVSSAVSTYAPLAALPLVRRDRRVLLFLAAPALMDWARKRPAIDPVRWTAMRLMDEGAHGLGVWRGCWDNRSLAPLRPRFRPPR